MYVPTMIVKVCIVIADLMGQWRPYGVRTYGLHCPIKSTMTIQTVTIIVGTYI
jgi:hypothetical protein